MKYIADMFMEQVNINAERIALCAVDKTLTFSQLNNAANRIANSLITRGVMSNDRVLVMLPRDSRFIISLLGVMKAGAGYVPVDPEYPRDRVEYVQKNSEAKLIISNEDIEGAVPFEILYEEGSENEPEDIEKNPDNVSYMIYTSGTTGTPKGVLLTQKGISNYLVKEPGNIYMNAIGEIVFTVLSVATVAFDFFQQEMLPTLLYGGTLVFTDEESSKNPYLMAKLIEEKEVDVFMCTPSRILQYLKIPAFAKAMDRIKMMWIGGEGFPDALLTELRKVTKAGIINGYGPSEITIASHEKLLEDKITIGKTKPGYFDMICDEEGRPVADGTSGELYIGGESVSPGYWKLDDLNATRFVNIDGIRYYKSGDAALRDADGEVHIIGRIDNQVKLHGLRIELGEIESLMQQYTGVQQAVVRVKQVRGADHLVAYYLSDTEIDQEELKTFLEKKLVPYMIPDYFVRMENFQFTPNGKVDARALPEIVPELSEVTAPETEMEKAIWEICAKEIGSEDFGVTDSLRQVGFSSLSLLVIASFVLENYKVELKLTELMQPECTVRTVCNMIEQNNDKKNVKEHGDFTDTYPLLPNQLPLIYKAAQHQVIRKITYGKEIDPLRLRTAVAKVINSTPYFTTQFAIENEKYVQKKIEVNFTEEEIPILTGIADDTVCDKFCRYTEILEDRLFAFEIVSDTNETVLLMRMHHILVDHGGMKLFCDRILHAYDNPQSEVTESYTYFDYIDDAYCSTIPKAPIKSDIKAAVPVNIASNMQYVTLSEDIRMPGNVMLAAVGRAAAEMLGVQSLVLYHTFGGRKSAKSFNTIGYFPYAVPLCIDVKKSDSATVDAGVLESIEASSPYDDVQYRRLTEEADTLFVLYNYMDVLGGRPGERYSIKDLQPKDIKRDENLNKATPHMEINCFSQGTRGVIMINYDSDTFNENQIKEFLENSKRYIENE